MNRHHVVRRQVQARLIKLAFSYFLVFLYTLSIPVCAEISVSALSSYLQREFNYAFTIDVDELPYYFNYNGACLKPVVEARVLCHDYNDVLTGLALAPKKTLAEEYWYYRSSPLGYKKHSEPPLGRQQLGAVVIRHLGKDPEHIVVAINAALRLLLDLQFKKLNAAVLIVPFDQYERVLLQLESYRFSTLAKMGREPASLSGQQFSIRLQSYPGLREETLFYVK